MSRLNFETTVVQMRPIPGNIKKNVRTMIENIDRARKSGVKLVVFGELCTTGYMLGDRWEDDAFIREIVRADRQIREASKGMVVIWGSIRADDTKLGEDGRMRKYNAAFIAADGEWVSNGRLSGWVPKTNLPKYRIFDDARHFYPAAKLAFEMGVDLSDILRPFRVRVGTEEVSIALAVCEDLWEDEYNTKVSRIYAKHTPDLLIDISSSPWTAEKWHARDNMLTKRAMDVGCPILYVNIVGLQNNGKNLVWFDGGSCFVDKTGEVRWRDMPHREAAFTLYLNPVRWMGPVVQHKRGIDEIYHAQIAARRAFYAPFKRVVSGLSGGIDSAVDMALNTEAVGPKKMLAINMPTRHNSRTTRNLARQCAENLGIEYKELAIERLYDGQLEFLEQWAGYRNTAGLVKENIQARLRGSVLAMIAAAEEGVFTCNGNKTELSLNYFTLYGDGAGAAAFLADLWKGQIYGLARFINERAGKEIIPQGIIDIVPSAELSADQNVDEGKGDPIYYPYHDKLLRAFVEFRWNPETVLEKYRAGTLEEVIGCPQGTIAKYFKTPQAFVENLEWCWRQYNIEYKRVQLPPVFIASRRAFGFDRRDTIADGYLTEEYNRLKELVLKVAA